MTSQIKLFTPDSGAREGHLIVRSYASLLDVNGHEVETAVNHPATAGSARLLPTALWLLVGALPLHMRRPGRWWYVLPLVALAITWLGVNLFATNSLHAYLAN